MSAEIGEYLVGAYLKLIEECDFVDYNVRGPGGGLRGLEEIDVIGIRFATTTAFVCEVMTHIRGLNRGTNEKTVKEVKEKYRKQQEYARQYLTDFYPEYMFWSPYVPVGYITSRLAEIEGLQLVINGEYKRRVGQLRKKARKEKQDTGNPVFRVLQIIEALRD